MENVEAFILLVSLGAAFAGSLILLVNLAGRRARLVKAYKIVKLKEQREHDIARQQQNAQNEDMISDEDLLMREQQDAVMVEEPQSV